MSDLPKRLRIKASMIALGERIPWGSDTALMEEAADMIEALSASVENHQLHMLGMARDRDQLRAMLTAQPQASAAQSAPVIDLEANAWESIKQAASESKWIPAQYFMGDWVADVCEFQTASLMIITSSTNARSGRVTVAVKVPAPAVSVKYMVAMFETSPAVSMFGATLLCPTP